MPPPMPPASITSPPHRFTPASHPTGGESPHLDLLRALPLPAGEIEVLVQRLGRGLLPLQERALSECLLAEGQSLLVSAPTSSGKTLVAELACRMAMARGRRAVYLAPTRALAEEVGASFRRWMPGRRVIVATREHPEGSTLFAQSAFDLAVTIPEKLLTLLMQRPQLAGDIGLVVADELELIGESGRGADLDLLLTFLRRRPGIQLLGLAPLLAPSPAMAQWFGGLVLRETQRPHPLREGVLDITTGIFHYRETGDERTMRGQELLVDEADALPADPDHDYRAAVLELVRRWSLEGRRGLVFVPRRDAAQAWATHLACCLTDTSFSPSDAMPLADDSMLSEALEPCLKAGVGFHHAEMPARVRHRVEEMARNGELCVIFATGTLGAGVNLPGEYVISMPGTLMEPRPGDPGAGPQLSARRFRNQGGRAGRFGQLEEATPGRSMVLVQGDTERHHAWSLLIEAPPAALASALHHEPLEASLLRLLALGVPGTPEVMQQFLAETLAGCTHWRGLSSFPGTVAESLALLAAQGLATTGEAHGAGHLVPTTLGRVTASSGISFESAFCLRDYLQSLGDDMPCRLEVLALASFLPDAMALPIRLSGFERQRCNYARTLRTRLSEPARQRLKASLQPEGGLRPVHLAAAKRALALADWLGTDATADLERRYEMYAGAFQGAALDVQWLIEAAATLDEALGGPPERVALMRQLAQGLPLGIGPEFHGLAPLRRLEPSRAELHHLIREGMTSVEALADIEPGFLEPSIPGPRAAQMVAAAVAAMAARRRMAWQPGLVAPPVLSASAPARVTSGTAASGVARAPVVRLVRGGSRAWFRGQPADLTPTAAEMLLLLASRRGQVVRFDELMHALWNSPPELRQVHQHKRAILTAAEPHLDQQELRLLVETVRGNGLRMNLPEQEVAIANY